MDKIVLERITEIANQPPNRVEEDYDCYLRRPEDLFLKHIFVKVMWDTKRIYIDYAPEFDLIEDPLQLEIEAHDENCTEYIDFADAERYFREHKIYMEV